jgi:hypothetical protein
MNLLQQGAKKGKTKTERLILSLLQIYYFTGV